MKDSSKFRLAMTILVRDEIDVIEENIRFHASIGVDKFVVTDNSSKDGTREVLDLLSKVFDLTVFDEPSLSIDQDLWVSGMADWLKNEDSADWIINNDADELWYAHSGNLKDDIADSVDNSDEAYEDVGVLLCPRQNMIGSRESVSGESYRFFQNNYAVIKNLLTATDSKAWTESGGDIIIRKVPGKVITRTEGLQSVGMGNHRAKHDALTINCSNISVFHYPIRSFAQFEKKVVNYGSSLENNDRFGENISKHLRHWYACFREGSLREQYQSFVLSESVLEDLAARGIVQIDDRVSFLFSDAYSEVV